MRLDAPSQLQQIYARFPSLKVNADKGALEAAAIKVLGPARAKALLKTLIHKTDYLAARNTALKALLDSPPQPSTQQQNRQRVVVAGLSSGGALAAIVAARSGYAVEAYEQRGSYVRNMQFSTRQDAINELASIDPKLADDFLERSAWLSGGNVFTSAKGKRTETLRAEPTPGDPTAVPKSGEEMLSGVPISLVECKMMEDLIFDYLEKIPGITVNTKMAVTVGPRDSEGNFSATAAEKGGQPVDLGRPFLIIGATGVNTPMREAVGIQQATTSPAQEFIGGIVDKGLGGRALSRRDDYPRADGTTQRVITMAMGSAILDKSWVLVGRRPDANLTPPSDLDPRSDEYKASKQALVETEFRKEAALVMETDLTGVALHGPMEGSKPTLFTLEQHMSNKATSGNNFIGMGDFVGNGHFTVGAGMALATTSHLERLKTLLFDLEMGADKQAAMSKYSDGAIADSMAWGRRGMAEFYPDVDKTLLNDAWVTSVNDWIAGKNSDPLAALEAMLATASAALSPIGKPAAAA